MREPEVDDEGLTEADAEGEVDTEAEGLASSSSVAGAIAGRTAVVIMRTIIKAITRNMMIFVMGFIILF